MASMFPDLDRVNTQATFNYPESFTERYRPHAVSEFVGLDKPKRICERLASNPFPSAWLFIGPSGTGKLHHILLQSIWRQEAPADSPTPNFQRIVKDAKNNVREALMQLETELLCL